MGKERKTDDSNSNQIVVDTKLQPRNTLERRRSENPIKNAFHRSIDSLYNRYETINDNTVQLLAKEMPPSCL